MNTPYTLPAPKTGWQSIPGPIRFVIWVVALTFLAPLLLAAMMALTFVVTALTA